MKIIYSLPTNIVFLVLVFLILFWSGFYYLISEVRLKKFICANRFLLIICIFIIFYETIISRNVITQNINLTPFSSFFKAQLQPEIYRSMFMNIVLFSPIGIFMPFSFKIRSYKNIFHTLIFALVFSISIETIQYIFSLGYCEIDDVIMNSLGAAIGSLSFFISKFIEKKVDACG